MRSITDSKPENKREIAAIRAYQGSPALHIGGVPVAPLFIDLKRDTSESIIAEAVKAGSHLYRICDADLYWKAAEEFDFSILTGRIKSLLKVDPLAKFLIMVNVDAPDWWLKSHPDECAKYIHNAAIHEDRVISWASHRWRRDCGTALAKLIKAIQDAEHGKACIGWQIAAGDAGEWRMPDAQDIPDTGVCMTNQFKNFALNKYRRNTGLLRRGWFDVRAEFDKIRCPGPDERMKGEYGIVRSSFRSRRILDYYEAMSEAQNTSALHFISIARQVAGANRIVGISYATAFGGEGYPESEHSMPEPVLDSPEIDFFANRCSLSGDYSRALTGSLALRGKFLFHVTREVQNVERFHAMPKSEPRGIIVPANLPAEALSSLLRTGEQALKAPKPKPTKTSERIAVIVDLSNCHCIGDDSRSEELLNKTLLSRQMDELARLNLPFDTFLVSDFFHPQFPDHKTYLFLNTFYISEAERRKVDARVKRSNQTAIWLWGAGISGEEGVNTEYGIRLCGQKLRLELHSISLRVRIADIADQLTTGQRMGSHFGIERACSPTITITDKESVRLGANTANKTVYAVRRYETWTSIVFGTPFVPAQVLRNALIQSSSVEKKKKVNSEVE